MVITVADNAPLIDLQGAENVGLQLSFDETSYRLMTEALDRAIRGKGRLGYLRDLRRMNVAITRARMKVIILGDRHTLTRHPFYRQLWQYIQALHSGG